MNIFQIYFLVIFSILSLFGCQKSNKYTTQIDNKSYINDFELFQENPNNQTSIKITSPKAIIDPTNNDIEIFDNLIEIFNENGQDFIVKSGNSTLNNLSKSIRVYNNVKLSFLNNYDYFITTNSLEWDLNSSIIDINNYLNINLDNTQIIASNGTYNVDSSLLRIHNTEFNRNIYNSEGIEQYQIKIKSDFAKWFENENILVFTSNNKQVESTFKFLLTK